jgi:hypothetical protein
MHPDNPEDVEKHHHPHISHTTLESEESHAHTRGGKHLHKTHSHPHRKRKVGPMSAEEAEQFEEEEEEEHGLHEPESALKPTSNPRNIGMIAIKILRHRFICLMVIVRHKGLQNQ